MNPLLSSAISAPVEALLNAVLAQDPVAAKKLSRHQGRAVSVECTTPLSWQLFVLIQDGTLAIRSVYEPVPDAGICGSVGAFSRLLLSSNQTDALFSPTIQLSGDTHLIQDLHAILAGLEIDWEDHFGNIFGDIATHQLGQLFSRTHTWSTEAKETLLNDIEEYVHEEARIFPSRSEANHFSNRVDELRLAVDRMTARQERLFRKLQQIAASV
ncbi:MAG: SCP2 sterol-binding domain-containing protein [Gammaproteobacteria bacterium]|nr:SCP2 sterol-binding domain-containing protein [Gammaproteobacteria bacterium]